MKDLQFEYKLSGGIGLRFEVTNDIAASPADWKECTALGTFSS